MLWAWLYIRISTIVSKVTKPYFQACYGFADCLNFGTGLTQTMLVIKIGSGPAEVCVGMRISLKRVCYGSRSFSAWEYLLVWDFRTGFLGEAKLGFGRVRSGEACRCCLWGGYPACRESVL